jgi:biopolymer transport protein ExbB/TolQ
MRRLNEIICIVFLFTFALSPSVLLSQEVDISGIQTGVKESDQSTLNNLFALLEQAGGIRYAIYLVLVIGIFLLCLKAYDLLNDKGKSKSLFDKSFRYMDIQDIFKAIASEKDHMLSRIAAVQLNVYQSSKSAEYLHDEISNYNRFHQDNFSIYRSRIDFLSDTAGALGLLGTVWGMFMVFSTGNLEKEQILAGMGVALLTTLLGLVVSIILNFFTTIIQSYFSKYLELIVDKADELRFRLMELNELAIHPVKSTEVVKNGQPTEAQSPKPKIVIKETPKKPEPRPESINPKHLQLLHNNQGGNTREKLAKPLVVTLLDQNSKPIRGTKLHFKVSEGNGVFNNGNDFVEIVTDDEGQVEVEFCLGETPGLNAVHVTVPGQKLEGKYLFIGQEVYAT